MQAQPFAHRPIYCIYICKKYYNGGRKTCWKVANMVYMFLTRAGRSPWCELIVWSEG